LAGQEVAIFFQTAGKFPTEIIRVLTILVLLWIFPKCGISSQSLAFWGKKFSDTNKSL